MTPRTPRVSIGLPVYNGERYIERTIDSLLAQTFIDFELIISDNASTDRTEEICRKYCAQDPRVRYFRNKENIGGSKNYTCVFEPARAPYFKWAAHDDICAPTFLEKCVEVLDANPAVVICYPGSGFIDQYGTVIGSHNAGCNLRSPLPSRRVQQFLVEAHSHCFPLYGLIRREVLKKTSLVAPYISSDQILLLQLALLGEYYEYPEQLFFFREHPHRSIWQSDTFAGYAGWIDPSKKSSIHLPRWRLVYEFLCSIARADIPWREAKASYIAVIKWTWWNHNVMVRDLVMAARQIAAKLLGRPPIADMKSKIAVKGAPGFKEEGPDLPSAAHNTGKGNEKP